MMRIFIIGQCSLHWGRMEFGNIGNYYIIEPFIRELHSTFPNAEIITTFQMSETFCKRENVKVVPMDLYYGWNNDDLSTALKELSIAQLYNHSKVLVDSTKYIDEVMKSDLLIDFSGDIWGDNADFLGPNRFLIGLIKDRVAQLLGKKTVMLAGSPGPFDNQNVLPFAKEVFANFDLVTNREPISLNVLNQYGFDVSKTKSLACPSFLFEPNRNLNFDDILQREGVKLTDRPVVGFILCGWNFSIGPFDKWPRDDADYNVFASAVEYMVYELGLEVILMSHSNGFPIPPAEFNLIHGRDYPITKQLESVLKNRGTIDFVHTLNGVYDAWDTKAIIGNFDMLVSGRVHGAIAGLSQAVPTVIIDYGHEPKAHKLEGFAKVLDIQNFVADPTEISNLKSKIASCFKSRNEYNNYLNTKLPSVVEMAKANFKYL